MHWNTRLALPLLGLAACGDGQIEPPPSIILISLDTVRADTLSCYGAEPGATPHLDALAAHADVYAECISAAPWTMPTHASLFTGLYPFEHGAHTYLPGEGAPAGDNVWGLHPRTFTLAEGLGAEGYRTAGIVANAHYLRPTLGLEAGFDSWDVQREPGRRVSLRALSWLDEFGLTSRPTFLFVNYMDAHRPYRTGDPEDRALADLNTLVEQVLERGEPGGALGERVQTLHQKSVTQLDRWLGLLLEGLKQRGLYDRSLIVVTADHGEAFGGHGVVEHSKDVYQDLIQVPLLIKYPGQALGSVRSERASSVDIPGLLASALVGTPAEALSERFPRLPGGHPVLAENYFSRLKDLQRFGERFRRRRYAWFDERLKLIVGSDGSAELYDLVEDPDERVDLASRQPAEVARMAAALDAFLLANPFEGDRVKPGQLSPAGLVEMRALGYAAEEGR